LITCANATHNTLDYCCDHTKDCCDTGVGRFRLDSAGTPITTVAAGASTATRRSSSSTSLATSTSSPSASGASSAAAATRTIISPAPVQSTPPATYSATASSGISMGAKIGIGIGAGCAAIGVLAGILWWRRRKPARQNAPQRSLLDEPPPEGDMNHIRHIVPEIQELSSERYHEMPAGNPVWELPGGNQRSKPLR